MKVLHIIPTYKPAYGYGGPVMSVSKLCESLADEGTDIRMLTTDGNGRGRLDVPLGRCVDVDGVPTIYFHRFTGDPHSFCPALWRYLYRHARDYDVIHIHSWWNLLVMVAARLGRGTRVILSPRGMLSGYILSSGRSGLKKWAHRLGGRSLLAQTFFHATSEQEAAECRKLIPGWQGFVIPNIIGLPPAAAPPRNDVFTIGFMSRIDPKKGLELLLAAVKRLPFPCRVQIAGDGDQTYTQQLRATAGDDVEWLGWVGPKEKFDALGRFDLLVLPSHNENFANVVLEALHMGTPVCISKEVGLSNWVEEENLGWITERTEDALVARLEQAYKDQPKRNWIRWNGRQKVEKSFSEKTLVNAYAAMYRAVALPVPEPTPATGDAYYSPHR